MIADIALDDALILPHRANPTGLNFRERQDRGARVVTKLSDRDGAVCGRLRVAARCRGGAKREVPAETWGDGRGCALTL
jgi:hypothetical protein